MIRPKAFNLLYCYGRPEYAEKEINGVLHWHDNTMAQNFFRPMPKHKIDRLTEHVQTRTKIRTHHELLTILHIEAAGISRMRTGVMKEVPEHWLLRMHEFSGVSLEILRYISGVKPRVPFYRTLINTIPGTNLAQLAGLTTTTLDLTQNNRVG